MMASQKGHDAAVITLLKAKADINHQNKVRVGLAGSMVVSVQRLSTFIFFYFGC